MFLIPVAALLVFASCATNEEKKVETTTQETSPQEIPLPAATGDAKPTPTVTFKSSDGKQLDVTIDNTKNTATIVFEKETAELKPEISASGAVYANEHYKYTEHQGNRTLEKDGKVVFDDTPK